MLLARVRVDSETNLTSQPKLLPAMDRGSYLPLIEWIAAAGLSGRRELDLLQGFCERAFAAGLPLGRAVIGVDTLHPVLEGRVFEWRRAADAATQAEYGRLDLQSSEEVWLRSPFHRLYESGETTLRRRLGNEPLEFPVLDELRQQGMTDYVAMVHRFDADAAIGTMDCTYSSWSTDSPGGFADADLAALEFLVPCLALAVKGASVARITETLVETYLGHDAGHRVLRGDIERGVAETISAVLWFSDLEGYTRITDTAPPAQIIPLLNDYADAIASAIDAQGGQVLKFMGDGILATFDAAVASDACRCALDAAEDAHRRATALNDRRQAEGLPITRFYLGLHVGEVFYGNIGSLERLDFTVVGPAVNETSRIAAMCRSLDQEVLLSSAFAGAAGEGRRRLVSVGRFALRGVQRPQELFTLDPEPRRSELP
jgi:adenylate cyclase